MGGLDARWYVGRLGGHERVASLVTISTPHHGTAIADWCLHRLGGFAVEGRRFLQGLGVETAAFDDLTRDAAAERNEILLDAPEVPTVSYGGARPWYAVAAPLQVSFRVLQRAEGPNDGLVSAASAKWGKFSVGGMMAHLNDATRMAMGDLDVVGKAPSFLQWPVVRYLVIHKLPMPKSARSSKRRPAQASSRSTTSKTRWKKSPSLA